METRVFSDPTIPAFFISANKPYKVIPHKCPTGQVEFRVEGSDIDGALEELYSNASVGALDFIRALKGLRSSIFALKGGQR
jgi:hypothetical protein